MQEKLHKIETDLLEINSDLEESDKLLKSVVQRVKDTQVLNKDEAKLQTFVQKHTQTAENMWKEMQSLHYKQDENMRNLNKNI